MELLQIALTALGSAVVLFVLTKIMGDRQVSQLSMFDYINGITIGSIAAEMATSLENDFLKPLVAMTVYALVAILISIATCKSVKIRKILTGKPLILLDNGKIFDQNLKKAKLDINEFLTQCRVSGYFNVSNIQTAIMETNGKISFLPLTSQRPVNPDDLNLNPTQEKLVTNVISDGVILKNNLKFTGNDETWLKNQLHTQGAYKVKEVFLATCDTDNNLSIYVKLKNETKRNISE